MQKQKSTKKVTTVRFDESELQRIETAALKHHISQAEVIRIALKKEFYIQ